MSLDSIHYAIETTFAPMVVCEKPYDEIDHPVSLRRSELVTSDYFEAQRCAYGRSDVGQVAWGHSVRLFQHRLLARLRALSSASSESTGFGPDLPLPKPWRVFQCEPASIGTNTEWASAVRLLVQGLNISDYLRTHAWAREAPQRAPSVAGLAEHVDRRSAAWHVVTEAADELRRRFPGRLELRVERVEYNDGGGPVGGELFLVIGTELDGAAAHDKLEAFMDEYWLDRMQAQPSLPIPTIELL